MPALAIRGDIGSEELRRRARREGNGRVRARLTAAALFAELNPIERLWLHLRDNHLSHCVATSVVGVLTLPAWR